MELIFKAQLQFFLFHMNGPNIVLKGNFHYITELSIYVHQRQSIGKHQHHIDYNYRPTEKHIFFILWKASTHIANVMFVRPIFYKEDVCPFFNLTRRGDLMILIIWWHVHQIRLFSWSMPIWQTIYGTHYGYATCSYRRTYIGNIKHGFKGRYLSQHHTKYHKKNSDGTLFVAMEKYITHCRGSHIRRAISRLE